MRNRDFRKKKDAKREIAYERVDQLLENARKIPEHADWYAGIVAKLRMAHKLRFGWEVKKHYCKRCKAYLGSGTSKTRIRNGKVSVICTRCGKKRELDLGKKKSVF